MIWGQSLAQQGPFTVHHALLISVLAYDTSAKFKILLKKTWCLHKQLILTVNYVYLDLVNLFLTCMTIINWNKATKFKLTENVSKRFFIFTKPVVNLCSQR